jgi:hypothetical protein
VPGLFAKQCVPPGKWCKSTAFRHCLVESRGLIVERLDSVPVDDSRSINPQLSTFRNARVAQREPAALYPASH